MKQCWTTFLQFHDISMTSNTPLSIIIIVEMKLLDNF
jgi:hypothetical protein